MDDGVFIQCWDYVRDLEGQYNIAVFGLRGLFDDAPGDNTLADEFTQATKEAEDWWELNGDDLPVSSTLRLHKLCCTARDALVLVAQFDDHMRSPHSNVATDLRREYLCRPYNPQPLIDSLWAVARKLNDLSWERGTPRTEFPAMPTDCLSIRKSIVGLDGLVEWCCHNSSPITAPMRISLNEANAKAVQLIKADRGFVHKTQREWAKEIKCSVGLISKLPIWQATAKALGRSRKSTKSRAVGLTERILNTSGTGERDSVLKQLISDQEADAEPSPLENGAVVRGRTVRHRKRL
jgi:hypothetical protein